MRTTGRGLQALLLLLSLIAVRSLLAAELLRDINTGGTSSFLSLQAIDLPSITLFVYDDAVHGAELWGTDGTPEGTHLVLDVNPGAASSGITHLTAAQNLAF